MHKLLASTSMRLALGFAGLFIAASLLLVGILWWRTSVYLDREINAVVIADAQAIGDRLRDFGVPGAIDSIGLRVRKTVDRNALYMLADPTLRFLAGNLEAWPLDVGRAPGWYQVPLVHDGDLRAVRLLHLVLPGGYHLLVGRDVQDRVAIRTLIVESLAWAAVAATLLGVGGGLLVRRAVLQRVESINRTALAIVQGDLAQRVPTGDSADEFNQLARTINDMLQQIQLLIEGIRASSDVIAHDLRTPLAELRTRLEDALRAPSDSSRMAVEISGAVADIDRLIGTFNALLRLAEIDSGVRRAGFRKVDLASVVAEVTELYGPVADDKGMQLRVTTPSELSIYGDPYLLAQAIGNLVDNAVKFGHAGGIVAIDIGSVEEPRIVVADDGPGIPAVERGRVTERFFRGDHGGAVAGNGLGLTVVSAVARLHGGTLTLADNRPGLTATLSLPPLAAE